MFCDALSAETAGEGRFLRRCHMAALTPVCVRVCLSPAAVEMLFDAVAVSGDYLLASVTVFDPAKPERLYLTMDLNTAAVDGNTQLVRRLS